MKKILLLVVILILNGCASKPKIEVLAPNAERSAQITDSFKTKNLSKLQIQNNEELMVTYLEARENHNKGRKKQACSQFEDLAEMSNFPLNELSLVYTLKNCNYKASKLKKIWQKTNIQDYLKEAYYDESLLLAKNYNLKDFQAKFSYELSFLKSLKAEKLALIKDAVYLALQNKDQEDLEIYKTRMMEMAPRTMIDYKVEVKPSDFYAIGKDFEQARDFKTAREYYIKIMTGADFSLKEQIQAYNAYRMSFKVSRDLKKFLEETQNMVTYLEEKLNADSKNKEIQEAWVDAKINYARAIWTEHDNLGGRKILDEVIAKKIGSQDQLATLYWVYAQMHLERNENKEALKKLTTASKFKITKSDIKEDVEWGLIWNKYVLKDYKEIIKEAENFAEKNEDTYAKTKLLFWRAKALDKLGEHEEAKKSYQAIFELDQFGYYGLLSAMQLQLPLKPFAPSTISQDLSGDNTLDWLMAVDEKDYAQTYLQKINRTFKSRAQRDLAMSLYVRTEWYKGAFSQIFNFPLKNRNADQEKYISMLFPTPYLNLYTRYAKEGFIPIELALSITRQESTFDPHARSWADAFGLMQLIPEKASDLSKKYNLKYEDFNDLYNPETNIQMGTIFLRELYGRFDGKFAQTVAGYNASTKAIAVWEKERFDGDYLEFIEKIPYKETRKYIKLVFRNFVTYKRILNKEDYIISKDFFANPF